MTDMDNTAGWCLASMHCWTDRGRHTRVCLPAVRMGKCCTSSLSLMKGAPDRASLDQRKGGPPSLHYACATTRQDELSERCQRARGQKCGPSIKLQPPTATILAQRPSADLRWARATPHTAQTHS